MNLNQIINMVIRMFLRRGINWGINKGVKMAANRGQKTHTSNPEERGQSQQVTDAAKRARKAARLTRRL